MADLRVAVDDVELDAEWTDDSPETRAAIEDDTPVTISYRPINAEQPRCQSNELDLRHAVVRNSASTTR